MSVDVDIITHYDFDRYRSFQCLCDLMCILTDTSLPAANGLECVAQAPLPAMLPRRYEIDVAIPPL